MEKNIITANGYTVEQSISGYWRLMKDGEVIYDDSACDDLNEDKETAEAFFIQYITDYVNVNHVKKNGYLFRIVEDEKFYHVCKDGIHESHYLKSEYTLADAINEELD